MVLRKWKTVMPAPLVSVIIVTHNSKPYISRCLRSLFKSRYPNFEVIVVDCASTDSTRKLIGNYSQKLSLIPSEENLGFAAANNLGFSHAKGKYLLLLNPDTEIEANALALLVVELEDDAQIAAAQPSIFLYKQHKLLNLTGKEVHFLGFDWIRDYKKRVLPPAGEIFSISGAGVLLRSSTLRHVGLFDPEYFMYFEDSDLSWRIRLFGKKMKYVPLARVYHDYKYLRGDSKSTQDKIRYYERNRLITLLKNYEPKTIVLLFPILLMSELGMIVMSIFQGWFATKIRAEWGVLTKLGYIMKRRRDLVDLRRKSDSQLVAGFVSKLAFKNFDHPLVRNVANPIFSAYWSLVSPHL